MSETSQVTRPLLDALNAIPGVFAERQHAGRVKVRRGWMYHCREGWPDIIVIAGTRAMLIETKLPGEGLSKEQHELHMQLTRYGVRVRVAETVRDGLEHVKEWLREVGR